MDLKMIGLLLVIAFLVDRFTSGVLFVLEFSSGFRTRFPPPELAGSGLAGAAALRRRKLLYAAIASVLGTFVIAGYLKIRLLALTGLAGIDPKLNTVAHPWIDSLLTGLILAGGADRIAEALRLMGGGGAEKAAPKPLEVTGRLVLEEAPATAARAAGRS